MTKREELIREYGLKLAQQALWSPGTVRQIAEHALTHCEAPAPVSADQEARASLEERIADLLAKQWGAIQSAELSDILAIAQYLAENLLKGANDENQLCARRNGKLKGKQDKHQEKERPMKNTVFRILYRSGRINSMQRAGETADEILEALSLPTSATCTNCGELVPQGCCTCGSDQKLVASIDRRLLRGAQ